MIKIQPPKLEHVSAFTVKGIGVRTINTDESNPKTAKIPGLWADFFNDNIAASIPEQKPNSPVYGVYNDYESNVSGHYSITAGVGVIEDDSPSDFHAVSILEGGYLVFTHAGTMPTVVIELWQHIWQFFKDETGYTRQYASDFEVYQDGDNVSVYIGVI